MDNTTTIKASGMFILMTIGKTHSGKTTLGRVFDRILDDSVLYETDTVSLFLREHFPKLQNLDLDHTGKFESPSLKFLLFHTILIFSLMHGFNVIMSNSNLFAKGRKEIIDIARKYNHKVIAVYLNYPEELLKKRIAESNKDTRVMRTCKTFDELLIKQRERLEPPSEEEFDHFFEVKDPKELPGVTNEILSLYSKT